MSRIESTTINIPRMVQIYIIISFEIPDVEKIIQNRKQLLLLTLFSSVQSIRKRKGKS